MELESLRSEVELLKAEKRSLQEAVGRWKRKALGAKANFVYVAERHESGIHYISIPVPLPADDPLHEVQKFVRSAVLPKYYPYRYHNVYSSKDMVAGLSQ